MATEDTKKPDTQKKPGVFRRAGRQTASLLGFSDIKRGLERQVETIAETGDRAKQLFDGYREKISEKKSSRIESFEEAVSRQRLTKKDLSRRRKELSFASYAYTALFALTSFFFFVGVMSGQWMGVFTTFTFLLTEGALIFQTRFRVWQIDSRRLGSPKEYVDTLLGRA